MDGRMNYRGGAAASYYPSNSCRGGGGIHEHPLVQLSLPNLFTCMGCKELGAGRRYSCEMCNFEVHDFCGSSAPHYLNSHPLHPQHQLRRRLEQVGMIRKSTTNATCDVCGMAIKGNSYRCSAINCSFHIHPTCSMLSTKMEFPTHPHHPLVLLPAWTWSGAGCCGECSINSSKSSMMYRCSVGKCEYHLHAACAKSMVNGLHAHGIKLLGGGSLQVGTDVDHHHNNNNKKKKSNNMLGAAAKIASHVVIGFIGGLVEGIGEGVGEALSQNIINNKGTTRRRTTTSRRFKYNPPPPPAAS